MEHVKAERNVLAENVMDKMISFSHISTYKYPGPCLQVEHVKAERMCSQRMLWIK